MSYELVSMFMGYLEKRIDKVVTCRYSECGNDEAVEISGVLKSVVPFDKIVIDSMPIPFVGSERAIEEVREGDVVIYSNPKAIGYQGCYAYDHFALVGAQMELLGRSVKLEAMTRNAEEFKRNQENRAAR